LMIVTLVHARALVNKGAHETCQVFQVFCPAVMVEQSRLLVA